MIYKDLMDASKVLAKARAEVGNDDGPTVVSPAWRMLSRAVDYLGKQAEEVFREGEKE